VHHVLSIVLVVLDRPRIEREFASYFGVLQIHFGFGASNNRGASKEGIGSFGRQ